jgi:hypothetical protein
VTIAPDDLGTEPVQVSLIGIGRTPGAGSLLGSAEVELVIAGVALIIRGIRVVRTSPTKVEVQSPAHRHGGEWCGSIILPEELAGAVTEVVLNGWKDLLGR